MVTPGSKTATASAFEPLDPRLLRRPLDFLHAEHYRLRAALTQLDGLARGSVGEARRKLARALLAYFTDDYALYRADGTRDFFPMLRRRCVKDAEFLTGLDRLDSELRVNGKRLDAIVAKLKVLAKGRYGGEAPNSFAEEVRAYAETQRRHIAWQDAVLMPLARRWLTPGDRRRLAQKLAARHRLARREKSHVTRADGATRRRG